MSDKERLSDLLRTWANDPIIATPMVPIHQATVIEIADELDRLRAELEKATTAIGDMVLAQHRMEAENERLRAQVENQKAQIEGRHQYIGQDYEFRLEQLRAENAELRKEAGKYFTLMRSMHKALKGLHYGRMPHEVQTAFDALGADIDAAREEGK